jgi:TonB family protein
MRGFSLVLLALAAGATDPRAFAADTPAGQLTRAPAVIQQATPEYPAEARAQGLTGSVTLEIEISDAGEVTAAQVTASAGHGFDEAALAAARKLRFSPAEIDGKPAAVRIEYRFDFTLTPAPQAPAAAEASPDGAPPAPANLRGRVLEMGTRLPVVAALVQAGGKSAYTDREGRFALAVPVGEVKVVVSDAAHARYQVTETVLEGKATEVSYWILRTALSPNETVVTGKRERREVSHQALSVGEITRIPGVSGDTVKVVQNLPGVARAPFGMGQLVVRGGNPRDTRVYVDGLEVPAVFHFGGLTSIYSSELIKEVEFQPGNFGASSGRAIGGRVNLVTRDPGDRLHSVADVNLYQATAFVEGRPTENLGLALAARRSYADFIIQQAAKHMDNSPGLTVAPRFYDLQAKAAWKASPDDTLRFDIFGSNDRMVLTNVDSGELTKEDLMYSNQFYKANLRYDHRFDEDTRLFLSAGGGWQEVVSQFGPYYTEKDEIWSTTYRTELHRRFGPALDLTVGGDAQWIPRANVRVLAGTLDVPGEISNGIGELQTPNRFHKAIDGYEAGAYAEAAIQPVRWLHILPGVRVDTHRSSLRTLSWVDPRLAVRVDVNAETALKGAVGLYHQAPPLPYLTEEWGNPKLKAEGAWQYSVGVERKFLPQLSLDLELYYKRLFDLAQPTAEVVVRNGQEVPLHFVSAGTGKAYGAEALLRWDPDGRFFGWIAYSLSRTKRDHPNSGGQLEQEGNAYDQPHNLVAVGTLELPEIWNGLSTGFRLRYTTGNPYERVRSAVYDADSDEYQPIRTGKYDARMPDFFQLDLRVDKKWTHRLWTMSTYLEVQNVTLRKNAEFPAYNYDYSKQGWVSGIGFFPAFGVRAEY